MKWDYWIKLYLQTHCTARGLRPSSINAYHATLGGFREYAAEQFTARFVIVEQRERTSY